MALPSSPLHSGSSSESHDPLDPFSAESLQRVGNPGMDINRPLAPAPEQLAPMPTVEAPEATAAPELTQQDAAQPDQIAQELNAVAVAPAPVMGVGSTHTEPATVISDAALAALPPEQQVVHLVALADQQGIANAFAKCRKLGIDNPYLLDLLHDALVNAIRAHRSNFHELSA